MNRTPPTVTIARRWIASHNREWCVVSPSYRRGGSLAGALEKAAQLIDPKVGGTIIVQPDKTGGD